MEGTHACFVDHNSDGEVAVTVLKPIVNREVTECLSAAHGFTPAIVDTFTRRHSTVRMGLALSSGFSTVTGSRVYTKFHLRMRVGLHCRTATWMRLRRSRSVPYMIIAYKCHSRAVVPQPVIGDLIQSHKTTPP